MKIAIVHEMLIKLGGAERVLLEIMKMYPEADVYTLMYDEKKVGLVFPKNRIHCNTPAQTLYLLTGKPRLSLPLMPASVKKIDVSDYDIVLSSSSGFAHGLFIGGRTKHICYCHSPARYLWDATDEIQAELGISNEKGKMKNEKGGIFGQLKKNIGGPLVRSLLVHLRKIDLEASKRPTLYIANSAEVQKRIQKYYNRNSVVIWPPVDTQRFLQGQNTEDKVQNAGFIKNSERQYYVVTSALTPFKHVDRVIRVMSKLGIPVKIIGDGAQKKELQKIAGKNIEFLGRISDEEVSKIYTNARGFLMPQKEDAGIAPVEAMAAGVPVFGLAQGGLLETNIDGVTGRFFPEETDESFEKGFLAFHREAGEGHYDTSAPLVEQSKKFDIAHFEEAFREIVRRYI